MNSSIPLNQNHNEAKKERYMKFEKKAIKHRTLIRMRGILEKFISLTLFCAP